MKNNKYKIISVEILIVLIIGAVVFFKFYYQSPNLRYSQKYVITKGNIEMTTFANLGKEYEIGANKDGYAVFKTPLKAFKKLKSDYKEGLALIQKEYNLSPINQFNYESYKLYGWQSTSSSEKERKEALFVTAFIDIYENSFIKAK